MNIIVLNSILAPVLAGAFFALPVLMFFRRRPRNARTDAFTQPINVTMGRKYPAEEGDKRFVLGQI
jgi:hypothetical protein